LIFISAVAGFSLPLFAADQITYQINIQGLEGEEFENARNVFKASSILENKKSSKLISLTNLNGRIETDVDLLNQIMRSEGYYGAAITDQLARRNNEFEITLMVTPGPVYKYGDIKIEFQGTIPQEDIKEKLNKAMLIKAEQPARAQPVKSSHDNILVMLPQLGFPFVQKIDDNFVVDHRSQKMDVTFTIDTGPRRRMGLVKFEGSETVNESFLSKFIIWNEGDTYEQRYVDGLRNRLLQSNLFSGIDVSVTPRDQDFADINVKLTPARQRTIGTSLGYSTAEGVSGEVSWEHRNIFGSGQRLNVIAHAAEIEQSLTSRLEIPHFKRLDQTLSFEGGLKRQNTDAFLAYTVNTQAGIDRVITDHIALLANVVLDYNVVTDALGKNDFMLTALPFGFRWDSSDNLLDPSSGLRASVITAPSFGVGKTSFTFLKSEIRASGYYPVTSKKNVVLALRTRLGSIVGVENETLPATSRFFSGGGGSIRGYAFQRVGPLAVNGDPLGGRSVSEVAGEVRFKFENNLGLVLFSEGGNVYLDTMPKFSDFRWAAGIGARYSTGFGPIRFDIAFPLNKRTGDSSFQIYISLGQAF